MITLTELKEKLKQVDEVDLLELLNINAEDIVERFVDFIEDRFEILEQAFDEETEEQDY